MLPNQTRAHFVRKRLHDMVKEHRMPVARSSTRQPFWRTVALCLVAGSLGVVGAVPLSGGTVSTPRLPERRSTRERDRRQGSVQDTASVVSSSCKAQGPPGYDSGFGEYCIFSTPGFHTVVFPSNAKVEVQLWGANGGGTNGGLGGYLEGYIPNGGLGFLSGNGLGPSYDSEVVVDVGSGGGGYAGTAQGCGTGGAGGAPGGGNGGNGLDFYEPDNEYHACGAGGGGGGASTVATEGGSIIAAAGGGGGSGGATLFGKKTPLVESTGGNGGVTSSGVFANNNGNGLAVVAACPGGGGEDAYDSSRVDTYPSSVSPFLQFLSATPGLGGSPGTTCSFGEQKDSALIGENGTSIAAGRSQIGVGGAGANGGGGGAGPDYNAGGGGGGGANGWASIFQTVGQGSGYNHQLPSANGYGANGEVRVYWYVKARSYQNTTTTLSASKRSVAVGQTVTLKATVKPSSAVSPPPLQYGMVTFRQDGRVVPSCGAVPVVSGVATCALATGTLGADPVSASYAGGPDAAPSQSFTVYLHVHKDTVNLDVSFSLSSTSSSSELKIDVTVDPPGYAPEPISSANDSGTVSVVENKPSKNNLCLDDVVPSAKAGKQNSTTCYLNNVGFGSTYTFAVSYTPPSGEEDLEPASTTVTYLVGQATSSVRLALTSGEMNSMTYGTLVTIYAVVSASVSDSPVNDLSLAESSITYDYEDAGSPGSLEPITCTGQGQENPVDLEDLTTGSRAPNCTFTPQVGSSYQKIVAVFSGNTEMTAATSKPVRITAAAAKSDVQLTVQPDPSSQAQAVGVPVDLVADVSNDSHTGVTPGGPVTFEEQETGAGGSPTWQVVAGCASVSTISTNDEGVATCTQAATPSGLGPYTYQAVYCPSGAGAGTGTGTGTGTGIGASNCANWTSAVGNARYTPEADPTTITLHPAGSAKHPVTIAAGTAETVTATIVDSVGDAVPDGTVQFLAGGNAITAAGGGSCSSVGVTAASSGAGGTATCTFKPPAGSLAEVSASYTPANGDQSLTQASTTTTATFIQVGNAATTIAVGIQSDTGAAITDRSLPFGEPVQFSASVSVGDRSVDIGTVDFTVDGVAPQVDGETVCQDIAVSGGTATCSVAVTLAPGTATIGAAYNDTGGPDGSATAPTVSVQVQPADTATSLTVTPTGTGRIQITASVANTAAGSTLSPTGTVDFTLVTDAKSGSGSSATSTPISGCQSVALVTSGAGSATATCATAAPATGTILSASFVPAVSDEFVASVGTQTFHAIVSCAAAFAATWSVATAGTTTGSGAHATASGSGRLTLTLLDGAGNLGTLTVSLGPAVGSCVPSGQLTVTGGSGSLFGGTVEASDLHGTIVDATGGSGSAPELCFDAGSLTLPVGWQLGSVTLSDDHTLCFALDSVTAGASPDGDIGTGQLSGMTATGFEAPTASLPFGVPDSALAYQLELVLADSGSTPGLTVTITPTSSPGTLPYVDATINLAVEGTGTTATGSLTVGNLLAGGPVTTAFPVTGGPSGTVARSVTLPEVAGPVTEAPGLQLQDMVTTLSAAASSSAGTGTQSDLVVTAQAVLGDPDASAPLAVTLTGSFDAGSWTLELAPTAVTFDPFTSLVLPIMLAGQATVTPGGPVIYAFSAGAPAGTAGGGGVLATWSPGYGVTVGVDCVALAYGVNPACGAGGAPQTLAPSQPALDIQGLAEIGGAGGFGAQVGGSADLETGASTLSLVTADAVAVTVVPGLTVTPETLTLSGGFSGPITVTGTVAAAVPALGAGDVTLTIADLAGTVVLSTPTVSLSSLGLPLSGFFAYATAAVSGFPTGTSTPAAVNLAPGFTAAAIYTLPASVATVLAGAGFDLPAGDSVVFTGAWKPDTTPSFQAALGAPSGFPFLTLPGGSALTSADLGFTSGTLTLTVDGAIAVPDAASAPVAMKLVVDSDGAFTGTATVTGLTIFGAVIDLSGSVDRSAAGVISADVTTCAPTTTGTGCTPGPIAGTLTPFSGVPVTLSKVTVALGTAGLSVGGTMTVAGLSLAISGSLASFDQWALHASTSAVHWNPAPDVQIDAAVSGSLTDTAGTVGFNLSAAGSKSTPLFVLATDGVRLTVGAVALGNGGPPSGCQVTALGDTWLAVNGSLSLALGPATGTVDTSGCFDLTSGTFAVSASIPALAASLAGGAIKLSAPQVTMAEQSGGYQARLDATIIVNMPGGGSFQQEVTIDIGSNGFVAGGAANLSSWLGSSGADAYIYYSSAPRTGFETGNSTIGRIDLAQGLTVAMTVTLPSSALAALKTVNIDVPAGTSLAAIGVVDFASDTYSLRVSFAIPSGGTLFKQGTTELVLDSGFLQMQIAEDSASFGAGITAGLHLAAPPGGSPSTVTLTGELTAGVKSGTPTAELSLSIGHCASGSTSASWPNAFGIAGLTVGCAALQVGVTSEFPYVSGGFEGTVTNLPSVVSQVIGYQQGAPITFAFNFNPYLLDLSIGTKNSTTPALEPFAYFGQASLLEVNFAQYYIAPQPVNLAGTHYPAGFSLAFQGSVVGVNIDVLASVGLSPPSINFVGTVSQVNLGPVSLGPVDLLIQASTSPLDFTMQFTGNLDLGPGSAQIGPALQVGGSFDSQIQIEVSTSGLAFFVSGSLAMQVGFYVPGAACYYGGFIPYPCDYYWDDTGFSATLGRTGFAANSSGLTLSADGYAITFGFDGSVSVGTDAAVVGPDQGPVTARWSTAGSPTRSGHDHRGGLNRFGGVPHRLPPAATVLTAAVIKRPPGGSAVVDAAPALVPTASGTGHAVLLPGPPPDSVKGGRTSISPSGSSSPTLHAVAPSSGDVSAAPVDNGPPAGSWTATGSMIAGVALPVTVTLPDGDVLVAGGANGTRLSASAELYDPSTGRWTATRSMPTARVGASAVDLPDGDVLVVGGYGADHQPLASADLYDPATGRWQVTGSMSTGRALAGLVPVAGGRILVAGGLTADHQPLASAELYDPATGRWTATGSMATARAFAGAAPLPGGGALLAGGIGSGGRALASAERYDPTTGAWVSAGTMGTPRIMASAVALPDGRVVVVGSGYDAEIYTPASGRWTASQGMAEPVVLPAVTTLADGEVLVAGGSSGGSSVTEAEVLDPSTGVWRSAGQLPVAVTGAGIALLHTGQVVVAGGDSETMAGGGLSLHTQAGAWIFTPGASVTQAGRSAPPTAVVVARSGQGDLLFGAGGGVLVLVVVVGVVVVTRRRRAATAAAGDGSEAVSP
jgi:hypothetical protein